MLLASGSAHLYKGRLAAFPFGFAAYTPEELTRICDVLESSATASQ